jgi:hypothetical protein
MRLSSQSCLAVDFAKPVPGAETLIAYQYGPQIIVRWRNQTLTSYRAHPTQKFPYFAPVSGPVSGLPLTTESSLPYPHHRGLWVGCHPLNGGDYWADNSLDHGQIRSVELKIGKTGPTSATWSDRCEWVRKNAPSPLEDERRFTVSVLGEHAWCIDADMTFTAREEIAVQSAKHSFFALRAAPDISPAYGGTLMNSEGGIGAEGTYGKVARWCGYHGARALRPEVVEGITIMDHPANPWSPTPWFAREYGHLSPSPLGFLKQPWRLPKGESIRLRYRVVLHAGTPREAEMEKLYAHWANAEPTP